MSTTPGSQPDRRGQAVDSEQAESKGSPETGAASPARSVPPVKADTSFLEHVLAATSGAPVDVPESSLETALNIARAHNGQELTLDPIGSALVQAVLRDLFGRLSVQPAAQQTISRNVADQLLSDPYSRPRFEQWWQKLCEAVQ